MTDKRYHPETRLIHGKMVNCDRCVPDANQSSPKAKQITDEDWAMKFNAVHPDRHEWFRLGSTFADLMIRTNRRCQVNLTQDHPAKDRTVRICIAGH